tara:strand:+ start:159 stop:464 length:306 start_codon:yes stop_codon:yes gene_type:complete
MTVKNVIEQIEKLFGRQSEQYMYQLINDGLDDIASNRKNYTVSSTTTLEQNKRWYELEDRLISIKRVEIKDTNDRYVMIPKLADSHKILREDTESADDSLT